MNEDEAFIRAIVDNPGEALSRLVYADWLDDRDDPRGPYLRAEHETVETGDIARLREMAAGLDPVWVARVSRPPGGVCCNTCAYAFPVPAVSEQDLDRFVAEIGFPLTDDYRAFLMNVNGGVLAPAQYASTDPISPTHCLYSLDYHGQMPDRRSLLSQVRRFRSFLPALSTEEFWGIEPGEEPWFADSLPIGDSGEDFTLFYAVRGKYAGRLHLHDYTGEWCRFGWIAGPHGPPTLPEFLHRLPRSGYCLADTYPSQPLQEFWTT